MLIKKTFQRFILQFCYKKAVNHIFGCEMEKLSGFERYKLVAYVDFSSRENQTQFGSIL